MSETLTIGGISITLGGDPTQLQDAIKKVKASFSEMQKAGGSAFDGLNVKGIAAALGISAAFYKIASAISQTISTADQLTKTAQKLGLGAAQLDLLRVAADRSDVSFDTLTTSLRFLIQQMQDTQDGARVFNTLGVAARDANGQIRSTGDVLLDIATKFATFKDNADKSALAAQLFGRQGADLIPLLNQSASGIRAMGEEAKRTGDALDAGLLKQSAEFRDRWEDMMRSLQGATNTLTKDLLPALTAAVPALTNLIKTSAAFQNAIWIVGQTLKVVASAVIYVTEGIGELTTSFTALTSAAKSIGSGEFTQAWEQIRKSADDNDKSWSAAKDILEKIWTKDLPQAAQTGADNVKAALDTMNGKVNAPHIAGADEIARQIQTIRENSTSLNQELAQLQALLLGNKSAIDTNSQAWQQYNAAATAAAQAYQQIAQLNLQDVLDSEGLVSAADKVDALTNAWKRGIITFQQYKANMKSLADQNTQNMNQVLSTTSSALTQIFQKSKTAAIAAALINTYQGITAALKVDPPWGFALAGLVAAQGFAQVANIRSTSQSSSGGNSGAGSSATSAAAAPVAPAAAAPTQTLEVIGLNRNALFSSEAVRDLASRLIDFQKDGGKVVLA